MFAFNDLYGNRLLRKKSILSLVGRSRLGFQEPLGFQES